MAIKHLGAKLIVTGLAVGQIAAIVIGFMDTKHVEVYQVPQTAQAAPVEDLAKPEIPISIRDRVIQTILNTFGEDGWKAVAVFRCESGLEYWKEYVVGDSNNVNRGEYSVGIAQINLAANAGKGRKVHWDKVKGKTLEEKVAALKDPFYNIEIAKKIYDASGFQPWTGYTNGCYKNFYTGK